MTAKYDKERIRELFLKEKGDIQAVSRYSDTPNSLSTIAKYAREGGWYNELLSMDAVRSVGGAGKGQAKNSEDSDTERLERIRSVLYQFLVPGTAEGLDMLELRPKTYTEAVKCYLDVDSRIDGKRSKGSNSELGPWGEIVLRCMSSPEGKREEETGNQTMADGNEKSTSDAKPADH